MSDNTKAEAMDKAEDTAMSVLVNHAADNTGVFGDTAQEAMTVHIGGMTADYRTPTDKVEPHQDAILRYVRESDTFRVKRVRTGSRVGAPDGMKRHLIYTLQVVDNE